jgi:ribosome-associated protein
MPKPKNPSAPKPAKKAAVKKPAAKKAAVKKTASKVKKSAAKAPADKIEKYVTEQRYLILKSLDDGKAEDILDFDLRGHSSLADYIIVASGRSTRQVASLAENISKSLKAAGHKILHREGEGANDWVIVDTGDIIVHVLRPEVRAYYRLEDLWEKKQ